jgi:hypothetical protein
MARGKTAMIRIATIATALLCCASIPVRYAENNLGEKFMAEQHIEYLRLVRAALKNEG